MLSAIEDLLTNADKLFENNQHKESIALLKPYSNENLYDVKWKLARAIYCLHKLDSSQVSKELIIEAFKYAGEAVALNENDYAGHLWYAVLLDATTRSKGSYQHASQLENFYKHLQRSIELNPNIAISWFIMGEFFYAVADLNWLTRKYLNCIFVNPINATFEEAFKCYEKADQLSPDFFLKNTLGLGKSQLKLGNNEKAKEYLMRALNIETRDDQDRQGLEETKELLKKHFK